MSDYTVKRFDEMPAKMGGAFLLARSSLGVTSFGMQILQLPPEAGDSYPNHDHSHDGQEEVYVVLGGSGEIAVDGEKIALEPEMAVRVGPDTKRQLFAGSDGLRLIILGGVPGAAYAVPSFTEPDPPAEDA
jgi:mannose-6-phosphate isomerase-like protein (cupin superfamily)